MRNKSAEGRNRGSMEEGQKLLRRVYLQSLVPNMIGILGGTVNVLFDGILVGQRLGELGIASVNQSLAVYLLLCTVGSLIAAGASAHSASAMGANEAEAGQKYYRAAIELAVILGGGICFLGYFASGWLADFLGSPQSADMVEEYIRITFLGGVFKILLYIPFFYLRLEGRAGMAARAMVVMASLNILLDYLFLFWFDWGIAGAAWASVAATVAACVMSFYAMEKRGGSFSFRPTAISRQIFFDIVRTGSPMAANNLFSALRLICLNTIMGLTGGSLRVAVFGITNSINEFSICIQNGVPQAGSAMSGLYYGERDGESVIRLLKVQLLTGVILSSGFAAVLLSFGDSAGLLFGSSQDIRFPILCLAVSIVLGTVNSIMTYYYYSVMRPEMANLITILRVFVMTAVMALALSPLGEGIWMFYWTAELLTGVIWVLSALCWSQKKYGRADLTLLKPEEFQGGSWVRYTVDCDNEAICQTSEKLQIFCKDHGFSTEQAMTIGLALEELMVIIAEKSMEGKGTMDVRVYKQGEQGILRIRSEGKAYNPLEYAKDSLEFLGVSMIMQMAKRTEYQSTLGLNTLIVFV